jgi:hypothetical protein
MNGYQYGYQHEFEINYDLRPYLPDIYIGNSIYNSSDSINNNTDISINSSIFIFNINRNLDDPVNDPGYLLFGIKKEGVNYDFPSLNYFYYNKNINGSSPYKSSLPIYDLNNNLRKLLSKIGYNILEINTEQFEYRELLVYDSITNLKSNVIYIYFNFNLLVPPTLTNYNKYASTTYSNNKYWNIIIYPYIETNSNPYIQSDVSYEYTLNNSDKSDQKVIETINFDDRETIKYYDKIDYKNFENTNLTMNPNTNIQTLRNYSLNINNYNNYMCNHKDKKVVYFNLNEISKIFYANSEYAEKNKNSYTEIYLNNKHINNYKCYSNNVNRYSYSFDNKISNLNFISIPNKNYSCYNYDYITNSTLYQQFINYYVNSYYDYNYYLNNNQNSLTEVNISLYKIFININPKIIDANYLLDNVITRITPLFSDSNILEFGNGNKKLQLFIFNDIKPTELYYINKYKIEYEFPNDDGDKLFTYVIILGIVFYNSSKINILNLNKTTTTNDLTFVNYTLVENTVSLSPTIFNPNKELLIYEKMININLTNIKKYMYTLNYSFLSQYSNQNNFIQFTNFYSMIQNEELNLKTVNGTYYSNTINIKMLRVNNFIKNFLNINDNFNNFRFIGSNIKSYLNYSILYDENIISKDENKCNNDCYCNYDYKNTTCTNTDEQITIDENNYIEYFTYFPKISSDYTDSPNYSGKYYENFEKTNDNNFMVLPSGKYIKFNFINYVSSYPDLVDENFVKSIKNIYDITQYNFSLLIKIPFNIDQDNNFYCSNPKYFWSNQYSANIGGNNSNIYLVLTDSNCIPFTFKGVYDDCTEKSNGLIYAIKLFTYNNYISENLKLSVVINLFFNKYLNFTQLIFLTESYVLYSDTNNVLWNLNESFLKLHNFTNLKEIINYDFKRFKNCYVKSDIENQFDNFNYKILQNLIENKYELNNLRYDIKILIYISNLIKTTTLMKKIYSYLEIIRTNMMMGFFKNDLIIEIVKYNTMIISDLYSVNYYLQITGGTFDTTVYESVSRINLIGINHSLENINNYQSECIYVINYSKNKLDFLLGLFGTQVKNIKNLYYNIYSQIYNLVSDELINDFINLEVLNDIDNFISNTNRSIFDNYVKLKNNENLLLDQIGAYLKILTLNLTKIDELFNLANLMAGNNFNDLPDLNKQVVKNTYIYNTSCYVTCTGIPVFNIKNFLSDTKEIILYSKDEINNSTSYKSYQRAYDQGIIVYIDNTINYFSDIINEIVNIKNLNINIYDPEQIGIFYNLLTEFNSNFNSFFNILIDNQINIFMEYDELYKSFIILYNSCQEYLLFVRIWNDFMSVDLNLFTNIFVNEDLYKIIKIDTFYDFLNKTILNFNNLIVNKDPTTLIIYLEKILIYVTDNYNNSLKSYIINQINLMINVLEEQINTGILPTIPTIMFGSYYIIPYSDLLLFKENFLPASFNFLKNLLSTINSIDQLNGTIFDTYYNDPEVNSVYVNALGYTYLSTPFKYININNVNIT